MLASGTPFRARKERPKTHEASSPGAGSSSAVSSGRVSASSAFDSESFDSESSGLPAGASPIARDTAARKTRCPRRRRPGPAGRRVAGHRRNDRGVDASNGSHRPSYRVSSAAGAVGSGRGCEDGRSMLRLTRIFPPRCDEDSSRRQGWAGETVSLHRQTEQE